ncbi:hypothetical protein BOH72_01785 [Mycobacterium sp. WY10]|nr:hypothetical protein BOH72_01785 [Mycobacterium sp. WY10]
MIFYHRTPAGGAILRDGFRDATGSYMFWDFTLTGVWLSDVVLDINEGAKGDQVLRVEFPNGVDLSDYEVAEDGEPPYREWCVPAELINTHASVTLLDPADLPSRFGLGR